MKRQSVVILAVVATLLLGGIAMAQSNGGNIYTGCLDPGGTIIHVAIGDQPAKACAPSHTQISWNETGPQGPEGPQGPAGPEGPQGPSAAVTVHQRRAFISQETLDPGASFELEARCLAGEQLTGGGFFTGSAADGRFAPLTVTRNAPGTLSDVRSWRVSFANLNDFVVNTALPFVYAFCLEQAAP